MIRIRTMTIDDLALGLRLKKQEGWNQLEADWLRFMKMEPQGCFVAELDGVSAGTLTTCSLGGVAWIAMVLVDVEARRKGVGSGILRYALDYLAEQKVDTIRLDATPAGRAVYEKLGFIPQYDLVRYTGIAPRNRNRTALEEINFDMFDHIVEFDKQLTGTDRRKMLNQLFREYPRNIRLLSDSGKPRGYITFRPGANAFQIGPCIAIADAGPALFSDACNRCAGKPILVDIPVDNIEAMKTAESKGLKIQRRLTRMYLGKRVQDNVQAIWAGSGPEKG